MTEKEIREIKRRFRPEKGNISRVVGCFVNENKQILAHIAQPIAMGDSIVGDKLLATLKKTLSGAVGTSLTDIEFSTRDTTESEEHALLMGLVKSRLSDNDLLAKFYEKVTDSLQFDGNYVILLASDSYDVYTKSSDGESAGSEEVFHYIVCAVCPVKNLAESLSFGEADKLFRLVSPSLILSSPEIGFMFPTFDDRKTNIYDALFYTRNLGENYPDFVSRVFGKTPKMAPKVQTATFGDCLREALGEECSYDAVRAVYTQIDAMVEAHKESRDPEPLVIGKETVRSALSDFGVEQERLERLEEVFDENFGVGAMLHPRNLLKKGKFEVSTPAVQIKVDAERRDLVSTQEIGGVKYVMIRAEGAVEVNGIPIDID